VLTSSSPVQRGWGPTARGGLGLGRGKSGPVMSFTPYVLLLLLLVLQLLV